jgi:hypothetical protein
MQKVQAKKYFLVFLLTSAVFVVAWTASAFFTRQKLANLHSTQEKVATDILSSETQFDLLQETSCEAAGSSAFSHDIAALADKIGYSESHGVDADEILALKKQYTILEVKDFVLSKRIGERCNKPPVTILYFYGTQDACPDCVRQSYVLDAVHESRPDVHVYSFDYNLDLSTIKALTSIYKIGDTLPAVVIGTTTLNGFQSLDALLAVLPKTK